MLRFYAYYKQATEGPCQQTKPAFWEVVKKAKWDAWTRLGNMSKTEAMNNYVEELKKIVETMSYTDKVASFLGSLDTFYESVPQEDLELLVGPVLERMRSQPSSPLSSSPLASRETSPHRVCNVTRHIASSLETSPASSNSASPLPPDTDGEEEEFIDTVETAPERSQKETIKAATSTQKVSNGFNVTNDIVTATMQNLQRDLDRVTARVRSLEGQALQAMAPQTRQPTSTPYPKWWPLSECSPRLFAMLILWPFVAQFLISYTQRYRQRRL
ncbi:Acyl-CoA-binding domain-containing protein 5 [Dufourea novaeangliae]|uniref:Acyl-CoA-binding domain-containing protein 5 n=1 Tax=Dufourea novaeangliae TaxID=178035 RepID=A0A154PIW8_DUFNO|nr:Acyl-CoA-binding domain-containing protein 5 [Dufourea novaeangliae]